MTLWFIRPYHIVREYISSEIGLCLEQRLKRRFIPSDETCSMIARGKLYLKLKISIVFVSIWLILFINHFCSNHRKGLVRIKFLSWFKPTVYVVWSYLKVHVVNSSNFCIIYFDLLSLGWLYRFILLMNTTRITPHEFSLLSVLLKHWPQSVTCN